MDARKTWAVHPPRRARGRGEGARRQTYTSRKEGEQRPRPAPRAREQRCAQVLNEYLVVPNMAILCRGSVAGGHSLLSNFYICPTYMREYNHAFARVSCPRLCVLSFVSALVCVFISWFVRVSCPGVEILRVEIYVRLWLYPTRVQCSLQGETISAGSRPSSLPSLARAARAKPGSPLLAL
jgi:hypothetical protein